MLVKFECKSKRKRSFYLFDSDGFSFWVDFLYKYFLFVRNILIPRLRWPFFKICHNQPLQGFW